MGILGPRKDEVAKAVDPICGMLIVQGLAVGPEKSAAGDVWFCSIGCQAQYQATRSDGSDGSSPEGVEA